MFQKYLLALIVISSTVTSAWASALNSRAAFPPGERGAIGACCFLDPFGVVSCIEVAETDCAVFNGIWFSGQACADIDCDPLFILGACCYLDISDAWTCWADSIESDCIDLNGTWYEGTNCSAIDCPLLGACCFIDNLGIVSCAYMNNDECNTLSGNWFSGIACADVDCNTQFILGACCYEGDPNAWTCTAPVLESVCINLSGTWYEGTICSAIECPLQGACCFIDNLGDISCAYMNNAECNVLSGTWFAEIACANVDCTAEFILGACCFDDPSSTWTCLEQVLESTCLVFNGMWYEGLNCSAIECPLQGACCFVDPLNGDVMCVQFSQDDCDIWNGTWLVGQACTAVNCADNIPGGCCYLDLNGFMVCDEILATECEALQHGTFLGLASTCVGVSCQQPIGACCVLGQCFLTTEGQCSIAGGVYGGDGVMCVNIPCTHCPGDLDGNGVIDVADLLILIAGWGICP